MASPVIPADLTGAERRLAQALLEGPLGIDALVTRVELPAAAALSALSGLELRGLVSLSAGVAHWAVEGRGRCAKLS